MTKPISEMIFREIGGKWTDASTGRVLADVFAEYDILIDDRCQFARLYDYSREICIYYRASAGKVTITIWSIKE